MSFSKIFFVFPWNFAFFLVRSLWNGPVTSCFIISIYFPMCIQWGKLMCIISMPPWRVTDAIQIFCKQFWVPIRSFVHKKARQTISWAQEYLMWKLALCCSALGLWLCNTLYFLKLHLHTFWTFHRCEIDFYNLKH